MKRLLLLAIVLLTLCAVPVAMAADAMKIGYVDLQKALIMSEAG